MLAGRPSSGEVKSNIYMHYAQHLVDFCQDEITIKPLFDGNLACAISASCSISSSGPVSAMNSSSDVTAGFACIKMKCSIKAFMLRADVSVCELEGVAHPQLPARSWELLHELLHGAGIRVREARAAV